jgi:hypothetical protein
MIPLRVEVIIDELVLSGFAPGDRDGIAEAVSLELLKLFTENKKALPPTATRSADRLNGGTCNLTPKAKPQNVGAHIARVVYTGLTK